MANKFISILEAVGKDFEKGLTVAVKYLPTVDKLAEAIFPASVAVLAPATAVTDLLQNSIVTVEQKYAAAGVQTDTGVEKAAEVLTLTESAVTTMLADPTVTKGLTAAGIAVSTSYVSNLIDAVVGVLNVQGVTNAAPAPAPAPTPAPAPAPPSMLNPVPLKADLVGLKT